MKKYRTNQIVRSVGCMLAGAVSMCCALHASAWDENIVISTANNSLVLSGNYGEAPRFSYYGEAIKNGEADALHDLHAGMNRPAYPAFGDEFNTLTSLQLVHPDGNPTTYLVLEKVDRTETPRGILTTLTLKDRHYPVTVKLNYLALEKDDVIEMWAQLTNNGKKNLTVRRLDSGFLPVRRGDVWVSHQHGAWTAEAQLTSEPLTRGVKTIKNLDGARNGHYDRAEVMLSLDGEPRENDGATIGAALCWSGNYEIRIDTDNQFCHNLMAGMSAEMAEYSLAPGKSIESPKLAITFSPEGMSGVSRNFHRWARHGAVHGGDRPRDILLNSWEGVYLNVNEEKMKEMMRDFAELGGELFVMDDGWFGDKYPRTYDNSSLGDWVVDRQKLPNGVEALIKAARENGLKFGIWIEPESANTISELYDKHPDWVMQVKNRELRKGRGGTQVLLDMSNPAVQDFVFGVVDDLLTKYPEIAYIKWDANVEAMNYGSTYLPADKQLEINMAYHRGLEKTLQRIREKYPDVVLQACGGGGGRVDYGVMPYFDEIWVSDNTDALQRIYMQWGTSMFYPSMVMAQHVSASPNHQTGRSTPLKFRFDVAMTGRLGMEMLPSDMTGSEKAFAKKAIADYKVIRPTVQLGDLYRLISPYDRKGVASLMYVSPEKDRGVFFAYKLEHFRDQAIPRFTMKGLDKDRTYRFRELNVPAGETPSHLDGKKATGAMLMNTGFELPLDGEYASRVYELVAE